MSDEKRSCATCLHCCMDPAYGGTGMDMEDSE